MKIKIDIKNLVLGAFLGAAIVLSVAAAGPEQNRGQAWEYKTIVGQVMNGDPNKREGRLDARINQCISEGWEMVSTGGVGEQLGFALVRRHKQ